MKEQGLTGDQFYIAAAELVVSECTRFATSTPQAQDFFRRPANGELMSWTYSARLFSVAEALFALQGIEGFDVLCDRMRKGDLKSAFAELYAARLFHDHGYAVSCRPEMGIKRWDYDFKATKDFKRVSVEVTRVEGAGYSSNLVVGALRAERAQLPDDAPAVIFCLLSPSWFDDPGMDAMLQADARKFFHGTGQYRGTGAINAVLFMNEHYQDMGGRGRLTFHFTSHVNLSARHPIDSIVPLIDGRRDRWADKTKPATEADIEFILSTIRQESTFFQWAARFWTGNEAKW